MITSVQTTNVTVYTEHPAVSSSNCGATPEARMLALMIYSQLVQGESARTTLNISQEQLKELRALVREALEQAHGAEEESGFWGDIGDVFGSDIATLAQVVLVAASCVATGGAAAIVLGAIAIACTLAAKYADELGIPPKVAIGIALAAAVASVASGNVGGGAQNAGMVGASGSGAAAAGSGAQASTAVEVAKKVELVAKVVVPTATATGAVMNGISGYYASEALEHDAEAQAARADEKLETMDLDAAIELLREAIERHLTSLTTASDISSANQRAQQLIIHSYSGAA